MGLTGGIGAGKSAVAQRLASHGAVVIDADQLARDVVAPGTEGLTEVVEAFGERVLDPDGALDRSAVGAVVFNDKAARRRLEDIIHPRVRVRTAELTTAAPAEAVVVNDVPLLVESGYAPTYHLVIVVEAAEPVRVARLVRDRGMSEADARARIRAQASDAQRRAAADVLLGNDHTRDELHAAVDALWSDRLVPFEANLRLRRWGHRPQEWRLVPYDPAWPGGYRRLAARLARATGDAAMRIDHVGSTAVPGLPAEDVIDIQLVVPDLATADGVVDPLAGAGFPAAPGRWHDHPKPDVPVGEGWEKRVHGSADPGRGVHLHVRPVGSPAWRVGLLLRDWLRADPAARAEYAAVKRRSAEYSRYAEEKERWFDRAWERARVWAQRTGWRP